MGVAVSQFIPNKMNLIEAPCASGKTFFAFGKLLTLAQNNHRVLYLIDTTIGKESLLRLPRTAPYTKMWRSDLHLDFFFPADNLEIRVMSYHRFGMALLEGDDIIDWLELVICDEFHQVFAFLEWFKKNKDTKLILNKAIDAVRTLIYKPDCYVVALSATPRRIINKFKGTNINFIQPTGPVMTLKERIRIPFRDLNPILQNIQMGEKTIIYVPHITEMIEVRKKLSSRGLPCEAIWSLHNEDYPMSDEQKGIIDYIVENQRIPDYIDHLIINAAMGTCINLFSHIDKMIVFDEEVDVVTQARGRCRFDIDTLYYLDKAHIDEELIKDYIGRRLFEPDKEALCQLLAFPNGRKKGEYYKWNKIREMLEEQGYSVDSGRENDKRYAIITAPLT